MTESSSKFWEDVYSRNISKMIGICFRYTSDRQLSEDLAHEAFLKAIDKSASFQGTGPFDAWLRRIVVNHVLQYLRDQKKNKNFDEWLQYESTMAQLEDSNQYNSHSTPVEFSEKELFEVIGKLPNHHRLVFNLFVIDDFSHAEIADKLGISPGTSKSHLSRARKKIIELLTEKFDKTRARKRGLLFILLPFQFRNIDKLYAGKFSSVGLSPKFVLQPDFSQVLSAPVIKPIVAVSTKIIAAASIGAVLSAGIFLYSINFKPGSNISSSNISRQPANRTLPTKNGIESENNSKTTGTTATISRNGVIIKNLNNTHMKTLDSLGLLFLVSASLASDTIAQPNFKNITSEIGQPQMFNKAAGFGLLANHGVTELPMTESFKNRDISKGTFTASSLLWSAGNRELYFNGAVQVNIGNNKFIGDGTFTFLGPVNFLVVDGKTIAQGSTVKLSKQRYKLNTLGSREARAKYGEDGRNGGVEISIAE